MAVNEEQRSTETRVTFYICNQGPHYVRANQVIKRESDGKRLCPIHLKPLRSTPIEWLLERTDYVHPIVKGPILNVAVLAATDFYADALLPSNPPCTFRIYVCLSVAGVFSVRRTFGGTTVEENLNDGTALTANAAYIFDILVDVGENINFRTSVGATILKMDVWEVATDVYPPQGALADVSGLATEATLGTVHGHVHSIDNKMVSGTDIGDVTINNGAGAAAVNIQDGGNSVTVDGAVAVTGSLTQSTKHDATTYLTTNRVSLNANGNLLAGVANKKIVIHSIWGQGAANIEGDIQDGAAGTNLIHFKFNDREGFVLSPWPAPGFWAKNAANNTAIYITFTAAAQSYWTMTYSLE